MTPTPDRVDTHEFGTELISGRGMQSSIVVATVFFAVAEGVPMEKISSITGLDPKKLLDRDDRLPDHLVGEVWKLLDATRPGEALPLKMASIAPATYFGVVAHAMQQSENIRDALSLFVRFQTVMSDRLDTKISEGPIETSLQFYHPSDALDGGCGAEAGAAIAWSFGRKHFGDDFLLRVQFAAAPHGDLEDYEEFFGTPVEFGTGRNELIFKTELLTEPNSRRDSNLWNHLIRYLEEVRGALSSEGESRFVTRIRRAIENNGARADYSIQGLADRMQVSMRSLQREAKKRNIRLTELVKAARMAHAERLLLDPELTVGEIAFLVGYSEFRAFPRAFKSYSGRTPSEFRRSSK